MTAKNRKSVRLDERDRTSLAGLAEHKEYEGYRSPDGVITLVPADRIHAAIQDLINPKVGSGTR